MKVSGHSSGPTYITTYKKGDKVYNNTQELIDSCDYLKPFAEATRDEKLLVTSTTTQIGQMSKGKAFLQNAGFALATGAVCGAIFGGLGSLFAPGVGVVLGLVGLFPGTMAAVEGYKDATRPPGPPKVMERCLFSATDGRVALSGGLGGDPYDTVPWDDLGPSKLPVQYPWNTKP